MALTMDNTNFKMEPKTMTHDQLDELMPTVIRNGVAAALTMAQQEGLIAFPEGPLTREQIEYRVDLCVGAFIAAVKELDPSQKT